MATYYSIPKDFSSDHFDFGDGSCGTSWVSNQDIKLNVLSTVHWGIWPEEQTEKKPHKCPVCHGAGEVDELLYSNAATSACGKTTCRSCGGTGIVWG